MYSVWQTQHIELNKKSSKLKQLLDTENDGCTINTLKEAELVFYERRMYFTKQLQQHTMEWYHHNLNQPGGD